MELHQMSLKQSYLAMMSGDPATSKSSPASEVDTVWSTLTDMEKEELKAITKKRQAALEEDDVELVSEHHTTPQ